MFSNIRTDSLSSNCPVTFELIPCPGQTWATRGQQGVPLRQGGDYENTGARDCVRERGAGDWAQGGGVTIRAQWNRGAVGTCMASMTMGNAQIRAVRSEMALREGQAAGRVPTVAGGGTFLQRRQQDL